MKREFYKTKRDVTDASVRVKANLNQNIVNDKKHINTIVCITANSWSICLSLSCGIKMDNIFIPRFPFNLAGKFPRNLLCII